MTVNGEVWAAHGHPEVPCSPPEAVHGNVPCRLVAVPDDAAAIDTPLHRLHQAALEARAAGEDVQQILNVALLGATTVTEQQAIAAGAATRTPAQLADDRVEAEGYRFLRTAAEAGQPLSIAGRVYDVVPARLIEDPEVPADAGHLWRVSIVNVLGSSMVVGDAHHRDHPAFGDERTHVALVRGFSLSEAFYRASTLPFAEWFVRDEHGRFCGMVDADGSVAPTPEGKCGYCGPTCQHCLLTDGRLPIYGLNADGVWACHADSDLMDQS